VHGLDFHRSSYVSDRTSIHNDALHQFRLCARILLVCNGSLAQAYYLALSCSLKLIGFAVVLLKMIVEDYTDA
jgi:hypothetical protein